MPIKNALTVDVEEWFQVSSLEKAVRRSDWESLPSLVEPQTRKVLDILEGFGVRATFFVLGYVARKCPALIGEIASRGHELAVHGDEHKLVCGLTPERFRREVAGPKRLLEELSGQRVIGHRAPSWSITDQSRWAFGVLAEEGFGYDSSVIPGKFRYGISNSARHPFELEEGLREFPLTTVQWGERLFPFSGGLFLRALPVSLVCRWLRQTNEGGYPAMVYLHPWELDPAHPVLRTGLKKYIIHYYNLKHTEAKLRVLLKNFAFDSARAALELTSGE